MKTIKALAVVAALFSPFAAQAAAGLNGRYYSGGYGIGPNGTYGAPTATFNTNTVCFPDCFSGTGDDDSLSNFLGVPSGYTTSLSTDFSGLGNHALFLDGYLNIATAGTYNIGTASDDASYLYLDGNLVVDNGGDHGLQFAGSNIFLTAGAHAIRIFQEENGGGTGLTAYLDGNALSGGFLSTTGGVPEPASWAMLIAGFGLTGAAMRRRRALVSAA